MSMMQGASDRFAELKKAMTADQALAESNRCLFCHDAPCTRACPTRIDVPAFIKKIGTGNLRGAARTILEANILGASCARVCPTEVLCEGACVLHDLHGKPIEIGRLQRHATDWVLDGNVRLFQPGPPSGHRVAVIGAGPAGLGCAAELARLGHELTIFEAGSLPGGLNATGVAEYKMTTATALREIEWVRALGVEIRLDSPVTPDDLPGLEARSDAIFLGLGLGAVRELALPGEDLHGVRDALEVIAELKADRAAAAARLGKRVLVIGGGNTAIDAATQTSRLGADEVTLVYRRGPEDMTAYAHEIALARRDGVRFLFQAQPTAFVGAGRVEGLEYVRTSPVRDAVDGSGRRAYAPVPDSRAVLPADTVIRATGQTPREELLGALAARGVVVDRGRPVHDPVSMQTANPRYFTGGDCANGGKEVVHAVAEGKRAARGIDRWLARRS